MHQLDERLARCPTITHAITHDTVTGSITHDQGSRRQVDAGCHPDNRKVRHHQSCFASAHLRRSDAKAKFNTGFLAFAEGPEQPACSATRK